LPARSFWPAAESHTLQIISYISRLIARKPGDKLASSLVKLGELKFDPV
jgi:hypothetical protein